MDRVISRLQLLLLCFLWLFAYQEGNSLAIGESACECTHGSCNAQNQCICLEGWTGLTCNECRSGYYGAGCKICNCSDTTVCDDGISGSGQCAYLPGTSCDSTMSTFLAISAFGGLFVGLLIGGGATAGNKTS